MSKIKVLDYNMINKIAAGEVVERPSSVVKELVENSIDAGSTSITIEIKDGGISLIRITDNGSGIPKADVKNAFLRHATSKVAEIEDLESLFTLGFRGEALSSISSVSQVEVITKTSSDITGYRLEIHGGEIIAEQEIGCADGTTFIMRNLFFNTPTRRKFLKKNSTESGYVSDIISKLALGHPHIAFKYINNGSTLIQTNGNNDLKTTIFNIYGKDVAKNLLDVDYNDGNYHITGFVGKPEISRSNRSYEIFFINGRYIKSDLISSAVEEAFKTRIMTGKFPIFILNLKMIPSNVDVNVHPTKLEVRFSSEEEIYDFVLKSITKAFESEVLIPNIIINKDRPKKTFADVTSNEPYKNSSEQIGISADVNKKMHTENIFKEKDETSFKFDMSLNETFSSYSSSLDNEHDGELIIIKNSPIIDDEKSSSIQTQQEVKNNVDGSIEQNMQQIDENVHDKLFFHSYKIIGQLFNTYWIIEQNDEMYLIDQHAAHEKILYENLVLEFRSKKIISQRLLSPQAIRLNESEYNIVKDNLELLSEFGFEIEEFGESTYAIRSVPNVFNNPSSITFFSEIIDKLSSISTSIENIYDTKMDSIATTSCKAAIKANDKLSYVEAKTLVEQLLKLENPFHCPHGRPTIVKISKYEIEKMFKRIV